MKQCLDTTCYSREREKSLSASLLSRISWVIWCPNHHAEETDVIACDQRHPQMLSRPTLSETWGQQSKSKSSCFLKFPQSAVFYRNWFSKSFWSIIPSPHPLCQDELPCALLLPSSPSHHSALRGQGMAPAYINPLLQPSAAETVLPNLHKPSSKVGWSWRASIATNTVIDVDTQGAAQGCSNKACLPVLAATHHPHPFSLGPSTFATTTVPLGILIL